MTTRLIRPMTTGKTLAKLWNARWRFVYGPDGECPDCGAAVGVGSRDDHLKAHLFSAAEKEAVA